MSAPLLQQTSPADNLSNVAVTANLVLTFDQTPRIGTSGTIRIYKSDGTLFHTISVPDPSQVSLESARGQRVIINPNVDLQPGTGYYVLIDAGAIENVAGDDFAGISSPIAFNFTTAGTPAGDTTAPTLTTTTPADNATGVTVGSNLVLTFSETVQAGSGNIEIRNANGTIAKTIAVTDGTQVSFAGNQLTVNPTTDLTAGSGYYVTMSSGVVRDLANNNFAGISSSTTFNFTTTAAPADTTAPTLQSATPADEATGVAAGANIVLTFNEAVQAGTTGFIVIRNAVGGTIAKSIAVTDTTQVTFSGNQVIINPTTDLAENHAYYVTVTADAIRDVGGNYFAGIISSTTLNFTTAGTADTTAPTVSSLSPADNSTGVAPNSNLVLTFNEAIQAASGSILIYDTAFGTPIKTINVTDSSQVGISGNQLTINPSSDLDEGRSYYVVSGNGVIQDLAGNAFAGISGTSQFNFTTSDPTPPSLVSTNPEDNAVDVAPDGNITLWFSEIIKRGSGNIELRKSSDGSLVESFAVTDTTKVMLAGGELVLNPSNNLVPGESYYITMASGVVLDLANNPFAGFSTSTAFNFTVDPDEVLIGTRGNDTLDGKGGDDTLEGLTGFDTLIGGPGDDTFILTNFEGGESSAIFYAEPGYYSQIYGSVFSFNNPDHFNVSLFGLDENSHVDLLNFSYSDPLSGYRASIQISTEQLGIALAPGTYFDTDQGTISPGHAGLEVTISSSWLSYTYGSFTIANIAFDYSGDIPVLLSLSVNFELDEGGPGQSTLFGTFNYNYAPAGPATLDEVVEDPGEGTDTVRAAMSYVLAANLENLVLTGSHDLNGTGNAANNAITGNGGKNTIDGMAGADTMVGGGSDDTYVVDNAGDVIIEDSFQGTDTVQSTVTRTLEANVENLTLTGVSAINGTGNNLSNIFIGNSAANAFSGGGGDDVFYLGTGDTASENSGEGTDIVVSSVAHTLAANIENLSLIGNGNINGTGNGLDNVLIGTDQHRPGFGKNVLTGGGGNDTLNGGTGFDTLIGGIGDDTYIINSVEGGQTSFLFERRPSDLEAGQAWSDAPALSETLFTLYDFTGDGLIDHLRIEDTHTYFNVELSTTALGTNLAPGTYNNAEFLPWVTPGHAGVSVIGAGSSYGQDGSFTIVELVIDYSGPSPVLVSFSATLELDPGPFLVGATYGTVNYNYAAAGVAQFDSIVESSGQGTDTVQSSVKDYTLPANVENLTLVGYQESLNGTGNTLNNVITGNDGDNILDGGVGADTMIGNSGNDTYIVDNAGDTVVEVSWSSPYYADTVRSSISYILDLYVENLTLTGSANINGTGNELNNVLTGNSGINVLAGAAGDDTYVISSLADSIVENVGEGTDKVLASIAYTLGANLEDLTLTGSSNINGTGNALTNTLIGNDGANVLAGAGGDDSYILSSLDDTLVENVNEGFDQVLSYVSYTLANNIEKLALAQDYGYLNGTGNGIANLLIGNTQNNILDGAQGNDTLTGGYGDDTFKILAGAGSDVITDFNYGNDTVVLDGFALGSFSAVQVAMTQNGANTILNLGGESLTFENILKSSFAAGDFSFLNVQGPPPPPPGPPPFTLPVSGAYTNTITGTRRVDNLTGTAANNRIDGKQGSDTMTGLAGDDTYLVDASGDNVVESVSNGIDTVISSSSSYTLANNVENLTLTGTNTHTATGNGLNNLIIASSRPDIINGGAGNDILRAGTGACVLTGGAGNDIFDFDVMGSQKQITDFTFGQDLVDLRTLLAWYGGSNPLADNAIALSAVAGGVLVSVKASAGGSLQGLVKITGVSLGDLDVGSDILWDA